MELKRRGNIIPLPLKKGGTRSAILQLVRTRVEDKTDFLLSGLSDNIANALFEEMSDMQGDEKLQRHFNIMRAVKKGKSQYRSKFEHLGERLWATLPKGMDESHILCPAGDVVELIDRFSDRTANHYKVLIQETCYRFQTLCKRIIDRHPLCPDVYYRSFWHAIAALDLNYEERCLVLVLFHRFVMDRYGQILAVANATLIELKIDTTIHLPTSSQ
ncbi:MAG: DUF1631 family protein [Gammaproteobacteria bacterium]|nr:DUF1631 family protein [Gammaproteobacteria bacterium]MBT4494228.1 DUF1631 family protein [Gammaproteobacteria bacterium]MBT7370603.1 DUF1631 family protein [Gammaproteobacteria bacterium]